jgi:hypothetical protein
MLLEFKTAVSQYAEEPLTKQIISHLLKDYKRPYDKINELVQSGDLMLLKRGIYVAGLKLGIETPANFLLANHLLGPSYVSLETALSYWGLIPERVYETSSVTLKKTKIYKTPLGRFSYSHLALPYYAFGIKRVLLSEKQAVLMASPEKAVCDKIILTSGINLRSVKQAMKFLIDDLRIDEELLKSLQVNEIQTWVKDAPKSESLNMLIKTIKQL